MKKIMTIISFVLMIVSICVMVYIRIAGIHLTEGELLIEYWPQWILCLASLLSGLGMYYMVNRSKT